MKQEKLFNKYSCPFCQLTSSRRYNMDVHIKRKHQQQQPQIEFYPSTTYTNLYRYKEPLHIETRPVFDPNNFICEPTSSQSFPPIFLKNSYFDLKEHKKNERRSRRREFYLMLNNFLLFLIIFNKNNNNKMPNPYSLSPFYNPITHIPPHFENNTNFHSINNSFNTKSFIDPTKMPIGHKIYQCKICTGETILPIFDFEDIVVLEKFEHKCWNNSYKYYNKVEYNGYSCRRYDSLISIINGRINSEKILLETIILPEILIQNPICFSILDILETRFDLKLIPKVILELLKVEKFIDLGKLNIDHWACRVFNSQNVISLEREELQSVVRTLNSTFGLVTFEINNSRKFMFCYIPLTKKSST